MSAAAREAHPAGPSRIAKTAAAVLLGAGAILLAGPPLGGVEPKAVQALGLVLIAVGCWATEALPPHVTSFLFFALALLLQVAPPNVVFAGFHAGAIWLIFGWVVLSARSEISTVWAVAVYAGILFLVFGLGELMAAFVVEGWRWLHALMGIVGIAAGVMAFAWPDQTFLTLAALMGWFLLFDGTLQQADALEAHHEQIRLAVAVEVGGHEVVRDV